MLTFADSVLAEMSVPSFLVEYFVVTPKGSRSRFTRRSALTQIRMARSETAVLSYLKQLHPKTEIEIISLKFV